MKLTNSSSAIGLLYFASGASAAFGSFGQKKVNLPVTKVENFTWADPFSDSRLLRGSLAPACTAEATFSAQTYLLHDLYESEPLGLWPYADALKRSLTGRPYPGGWDGLDPHHYNRPLLRMNYSDVPIAVRQWIEDANRDRGGQGGTDNGNRNLFVVFERSIGGSIVAAPIRPPKMDRAGMLRPADHRYIVVFAPGALYPILPLWVAEQKQQQQPKSCASQLRNLNLYTPWPRAGGVVAWITNHTTPDRHKNERDMAFTVRVQLLQEDGKAKGDDKEEL